MPIRTSIVTGKKAEQGEFYRFTVQDGVLVFDNIQKNKGRGGYVEKDPLMIKKIKKMRGKIRYLLKVDTVDIPDEIEYVLK